MTLNQTWDLDRIFPGGSKSPAFAEFLAQLTRDIKDWSSDIASLSPESPDLDAYARSIRTYDNLDARLQQAVAFVECLVAEDVRDRYAQALENRMSQLHATFANALHALDDRFLRMPDKQFSALLSHPEVAPVSDVISERRQLASEKLDVVRENLISDLSVDGYHGWGAMYSTLVGSLKVPVKQGAHVVEMSAGQAFNQLTSPDRAFREDLFATWEQTWAEKEDLFAQTLNHLAGHRLAVYAQRGWNNVLKEPLMMNRMSEATLDVMWSVISANKAPFVKYLQRKAQLFGIDKPTWTDVAAPVGNAHRTFTYEEAHDFIVKHFATFSPDLAAFADEAFRNRWIEVEDRNFKRPGGFCTSFPLSNESRIFMTYSGSLSNVATLAHELGHAYHQHVMNGLPQLLTGYAMNVAETASTFAEMIVADAAVKEAQSKDEQIYLLADKLERSIAMYMDIHCRFLFETRFYEARKQGMVDAAQLNQLMADAQKDAFADALGSYHPHFWAAKLHFHATDVPFYNFPYTFGYLFSTGIYAEALRQGPAFAQKYVDLLRDTGRMQVEDLARKHLGVDLTQPDFWQQSIDLARADVDAFLKLTET